MQGRSCRFGEGVDSEDRGVGVEERSPSETIVSNYDTSMSHSHMMTQQVVQVLRAARERRTTPNPRKMGGLTKDACCADTSKWRTKELSESC